MIDRIRGRLEEVREESALLDLGGVVLEADVPPVDRYRLLAHVGERVELHTVAFLQGGVGGASLTPVLVGFLEPEERDFWLKLSGAGGLGQRTALRAMSVEVAAIARAIEAGDEAWLTQLPGIGRQRASELVARLRGKVTSFALVSSGGRPGAARRPSSGAEAGSGPTRAHGAEPARRRAPAVAPGAGGPQARRRRPAKPRSGRRRCRCWSSWATRPRRRSPCSGRPWPPAPR
ncbi:MAG: OB-fold domain-containing protein [Bacillota bacterium]|nr:OB-fold domain-containing protein [Bacillota bacterium]